MSNEDGASERVRRDVLPALVGVAEHLVDLEDRARLEAVAKGGGVSFRGDVQGALLGEDRLELLATAVDYGDIALCRQAAVVAGLLQLLHLDDLDNRPGHKDGAVAGVLQFETDVRGEEVGGHVDEVRLGVECRRSVKEGMSACPSRYSRRRIYPRPLGGDAHS